MRKHFSTENLVGMAHAGINRLSRLLYLPRQQQQQQNNNNSDDGDDHNESNEGGNHPHEEIFVRSRNNNNNNNNSNADEASQYLIYFDENGNPMLDDPTSTSSSSTSSQNIINNNNNSNPEEGTTPITSSNNNNIVIPEYLKISRRMNQITNYRRRTKNVSSNNTTSMGNKKKNSNSENSASMKFSNSTGSPHSNATSSNNNNTNGACFHSDQQKAAEQMFIQKSLQLFCQEVSSVITNLKEKQQQQQQQHVSTADTTGLSRLSPNNTNSQPQQQQQPLSAVATPRGSSVDNPNGLPPFPVNSNNNTNSSNNNNIGSPPSSATNTNNGSSAFPSLSSPPSPILLRLSRASEQHWLEFFDSCLNFFQTLPSTIIFVKKRYSSNNNNNNKLNILEHLISSLLDIIDFEFIHNNNNNNNASSAASIATTPFSHHLTLSAYLLLNDILAPRPLLIVSLAPFFRNAILQRCKLLITSNEDLLQNKLQNILQQSSNNNNNNNSAGGGSSLKTHSRVPSSSSSSSPTNSNFVPPPTGPAANANSNANNNNSTNNNNKFSRRNQQQQQSQTNNSSANTMSQVPPCSGHLLPLLRLLVLVHRNILRSEAINPSAANEAKTSLFFSADHHHDLALSTGGGGGISSNKSSDEDQQQQQQDIKQMFSSSSKRSSNLEDGQINTEFLPPLPPQHPLQNPAFSSSSTSIASSLSEIILRVFSTCHQSLASFVSANIISEASCFASLIVQLALFSGSLARSNIPIKEELISWRSNSSSNNHSKKRGHNSDNNSGNLNNFASRTPEVSASSFLPQNVSAVGGGNNNRSNFARGTTTTNTPAKSGFDILFGVAVSVVDLAQMNNAALLFPLSPAYIPSASSSTDFSTSINNNNNTSPTSTQNNNNNNNNNNVANVYKSNPTLRTDLPNALVIGELAEAIIEIGTISGEFSRSRISLIRGENDFFNSASRLLVTTTSTAAASSTTSSGVPSTTTTATHHHQNSSSLLHNAENESYHLLLAPSQQQASWLSMPVSWDSELGSGVLFSWKFASAVAGCTMSRRSASVLLSMMENVETMLTTNSFSNFRFNHNQQQQQHSSITNNNSTQLSSTPSASSTSTSTPPSNNNNNNSVITTTNTRNNNITTTTAANAMNAVSAQQISVPGSSSDSILRCVIASVICLCRGNPGNAQTLVRSGAFKTLFRILVPDTTIVATTRMQQQQQPGANKKNASAMNNGNNGNNNGSGNALVSENLWSIGSTLLTSLMHHEDLPDDDLTMLLSGIASLRDPNSLSLSASPRELCEFIELCLNSISSISTQKASRYLWFDGRKSYASCCLKNGVPGAWGGYSVAMWFKPSLVWADGSLLFSITEQSFAFASNQQGTSSSSGKPQIFSLLSVELVANGSTNLQLCVRLSTSKDQVTIMMIPESSFAINTVTNMIQYSQYNKPVATTTRNSTTSGGSGVWHHLALSHNMSGLTAFIDGRKCPTVSSVPYISKKSKNGKFVISFGGTNLTNNDNNNNNNGGGDSTTMTSNSIDNKSNGNNNNNNNNNQSIVVASSTFGQISHAQFFDGYFGDKDVERLMARGPSREATASLKDQEFANATETAKLSVTTAGGSASHSRSGSMNNNANNSITTTAASATATTIISSKNLPLQDKSDQEQQQHHLFDDVEEEFDDEDICHYIAAAPMWSGTRVEQGVVSSVSAHVGPTVSQSFESVDVLEFCLAHLQGIGSVKNRASIVILCTELLAAYFLHCPNGRDQWGAKDGPARLGAELLLWNSVHSQVTLSLFSLITTNFIHVNNNIGSNGNGGGNNSTSSVTTGDKKVLFARHPTCAKILHLVLDIIFSPATVPRTTGIILRELANFLNFEPNVRYFCDAVGMDTFLAYSMVCDNSCIDDFVMVVERITKQQREMGELLRFLSWRPNAEPQILARLDRMKCSFMCMLYDIVKANEEKVPVPQKSLAASFLPEALLLMQTAAGTGYVNTGGSTASIHVDPVLLAATSAAAANLPMGGDDKDAAAAMGASTTSSLPGNSSQSDLTSNNNNNNNNNSSSSISNSTTGVGQNSTADNNNLENNDNAGDNNVNASSSTTAGTNSNNANSDPNVQMVNFYPIAELIYQAGGLKELITVIKVSDHHETLRICAIRLICMTTYCSPRAKLYFNTALLVTTFTGASQQQQESQQFQQQQNYHSGGVAVIEEALLHHAHNGSTFTLNTFQCLVKAALEFYRPNNDAISGSILSKLRGNTGNTNLGNNAAKHAGKPLHHHHHQDPNSTGSGSSSVQPHHHHSVSFSGHVPSMMEMSSNGTSNNNVGGEMNTNGNKESSGDGSGNNNNNNNNSSLPQQQQNNSVASANSSDGLDSRLKSDDGYNANRDRLENPAFLHTLLRLLHVVTEQVRAQYGQQQNQQQNQQQLSPTTAETSSSGAIGKSALVPTPRSIGVNSNNNNNNNNTAATTTKLLQTFSSLALQVFKYVDGILSLTPNVSKMIAHSGYSILEELFETSKPFTFMIFANQLEGTRCSLMAGSALAMPSSSSSSFENNNNNNNSTSTKNSDASQRVASGTENNNNSTPRNGSQQQVGVRSSQQDLQQSVSSFASVLSSNSIASLTRHIIRSVIIIDVIKNAKTTTKTCFMSDFLANPPLQRILLEETFREMSGRHRIENLDATDVNAVMKNLEILMLCLEEHGYVVNHGSEFFPSSLGLELIRCIDSIAAESTPAIRSKLMKTKLIELRNRLALHLLASSDASPSSLGRIPLQSSTSNSANATPNRPIQNKNDDDNDATDGNAERGEHYLQHHHHSVIPIVSEEEEKQREKRMLAVVQCCRTDPNATLLLFKFILDAVKAQNAEQLSAALTLLRALFASEIEQRNAIVKIVGSGEHVDLLIKSHRVDSATGQMIPNHFGAWVREHQQEWESQLGKKLSKAVKPVESEIKSRQERREKDSQSRYKQLLQEKEKKINQFNKTSSCAAKVVREVEQRTITATERTFTRIQNERVERFDKYAEYELMVQ